MRCWPINSKLFLTEQLLSIFIFAICAAVCVRIFAYAHALTDDSRDLNNALIIAESGAESFKAAFGNIEKTALYLDGCVTDNSISVYYDMNSQICDISGAYYIMSITCEDASGLLIGGITVQKAGGDEIFALSVAAGQPH